MSLEQSTLVYIVFNLGSIMYVPRDECLILSKLRSYMCWLIQQIVVGPVAINITVTEPGRAEYAN